MQVLAGASTKIPRLNERMYGALTGLNKKETVAKFGEEQVKQWRRSYSTPPPEIDTTSEYWPGNDNKYAHIPMDEIPLSECLKDTVDRCLPYWKSDIMPALQPSPELSMHVVFSAECIPAFDWQSIGLFYSFYRTKQPGKITRLLACSDDQLKTYDKRLLEMGPTFVHFNMRYDHANDVEAHDRFHDGKAGHGYASYNKPYSVHAWLSKVDVKEDMILMVDTDMWLRQPINPIALGSRPGNVVSAGAALRSACARALAAALSHRGARRQSTRTWSARRRASSTTS